MKILCAVDGSEFSHWAVKAIGNLFHQSLKEVVLLHVIDNLPFKQGLKKEGVSTGKVKKMLGLIEKEAKKLLKEYEDQAALTISQSMSKPFVKIRTVLEHGPANETILKQAEKRKADVIVMGSRGLSDLKGYLMGSVSRKVLSHASCAVLIVKETIPEVPHAVLALDGSKASLRAVNSLKRWVLPDMISVHVLSVVPQVLTDLAPRVLRKSQVKALTEPLEQRAQECTAQYREMLLKENFEVTSEVLPGNPRAVILSTLEKRKADLAILGSKGLTGSVRFQLGSVSEWVAAYSSCSVLVVRPPVK
jgi:nucleotide-binding universal stress UspA family protein